jgi:VRR-NUC domain
MLSLAAERSGDNPALDIIQAPDRRRDTNAEARIQAAIVEYVRLVAPHVLIFAIPNGGLRTKAEAARLKWTGVVAGIPDLAIVAPGRRVFFIEVKAPSGALSLDQRAIRDWLIALGSPPAICRSIDDARRALAAWGIATSEAAR